MPATAEPDDTDVVIATFNVEQNGFGDPGRRRAAYDLLRQHHVQLLFRQEMFLNDKDRRAVMYEAEEALGLRGWLDIGGNANAVFADTSVFRPLGEWPAPWNGFKLPPTAVTLQLRDAGVDSTPIIAVAAHLNYAVPVLREIEAGWTTYWNDKWVTLPSGTRKHAVMLAGLDGNSYPRTAAPGVHEVPLPELTDIKDDAHRAHRSRPGPAGTRVMDQVPHDVLHTARVRDIALHLAETTQGRQRLEPTMLACDTHGPSTRVDWLVASRPILPAFREVVTVDAQHVSDHNLVIAHADRRDLARLLSDAPARALSGPAA